MDELTGRASRAAMWSGIEAWGRRLGSVVIFVLLARLLEPEDFGLAAIALVFVLILGMIQYSGPIRALVQYDEVSDEDLHTGFWLGLLFALVMVVVLLVTAPWLASAFGEPRLSAILRVGSLALVAGSAATVPTALMMRELDFRSLALRSIGATVGSGILAVVLAVLGAGVWALIWQNVTFSAIQTALVWSRTPYRPRPSLGRSQARRLFSMSWRFAGADLLMVSDKRFADLAIGGLLGTAALGFYSVAYRFLDVLSSLFVEAVSNVSRPLFARVQGEPARLLNGVTVALRQSAVISFPAFVGMAVMAHEITVVVFGAQWQPSVPVMRLLAIVGLLTVVEALLTNAIAGVGQVSWHLWARSGFAIGNIAVILPVILVSGDIVAVAGAMVAWRLLYLPVYLRVLHRALPYRLLPLARSVAGPAGASLLMAGCVVAARGAVGWSPTPTSLIAGIVLGAATYALAIVVLDRTAVREAVTLVRRAVSG